MGSFNTTCAISRAPIREGDKVRLFFLASDAHTYPVDLLRTSISKGCQCYVWDDFKVIGGISLEATYSDYNTYEFDENSLFSRYIRWIIRGNYSMNVSEVGKEYNEFHDHMDVPPEDLSWEKIFDMQHSGRLFLKGYGSGHLPFVGIMAIHESVYQIMLNESYEVYQGYPDGVSWNSGYNPYKTVNFESCLKAHLEEDEEEKVREHAKFYTDSFDHLVEEGKCTREEADVKVLEMARRMLESRSESRVEYSFTRGSTPYAQMRDLFNANQDKDLGGVTLEDIKAKAYEGMFFTWRMDAHNIMYRPLATSGQEHDLVADGVFLQKVGAAVGAIGSNWEEEEHIVTRKFSKSWQEITVSEIQERMNDWFEPHEELYVEFKEKFDELMKDKDVVIVSSEELQSDEFKYLRNFIWNKSLELHIQK